MGIFGPYCNQSVSMIFCAQSSINKYSRNLLDSTNITAQARENKETNNNSSSEKMTSEYKHGDTNASVFITADNFITCNDSIESSCLANGDWSIYAMELVSVTSQFVISLTDLSFNQTPSTGNSSGIMLMSYVRYNAMPLKSLHDYSSDLSVAPLIVKSPKIGRWFIAFQAVNQTESSGVMHETFFGGTTCFSVLLQVPECNSGKAGLNCSWEAHTLQVTTIKLVFSSI